LASDRSLIRSLKLQRIRAVLYWRISIGRRPVICRL
jgi:hypothetical protein